MSFVFSYRSKMPRRSCSDPFRSHPKKITTLTNLRNVTPEMIDTGIVEEGDFVCVNCYKNLKKPPPPSSSSAEKPNTASSEQTISIEASSAKELNSATSASEDESETIALESSAESSAESTAVDCIVAQATKVTDEVLPLVGETPVKRKGLTKEKKVAKIKKKLQTSQESLRRSLEVSYGATLSDSEATLGGEIECYENLMANLKEEFQGTSDRARKLQILTLSPFGLTKTMEYFETTNYLVKLSRKMRNENGILPKVPELNKGRQLSKDDKEKVIAFYERDEISRQCPGKKDFVSIKVENGDNLRVQKRLILGNLREIYIKFKEEGHNPQIGFSTFCALRPKQCVLAGSGGTHSVCVCTHHQNPKLQLNAIGEKNLRLDDVMEKGVCDINSEDCMMRRCPSCPGEEAIVSFVCSLPAMEEKEEVCYKKWVTVDRCNLENVVETTDEFVSSFSSAIMKLTRHHYVSKMQSANFQQKKDNLKENEALLVGDFAENYSFIVQDAAQGFHWETSQCTLHPFVFYFQESESTKHKSFCFVSDGKKHSHVMVHTFLRQLVPLLKKDHPNLQKIHYWSDGCGGQYKNKFNFVNLYHHKDDFEIDAEWNFFATSHGKNACDGIGGTLKRSVARASLQRPYDKQILTPQDFYNYCQESITSIKTFFVPNEVVEQTGKELEHRFSKALTIPGTQKNHRFVPAGSGHLEIYEVSANDQKRKVRITKDEPSGRTRQQNVSEERQSVEENNPIAVGTFVAVEEDRKMWIAHIDAFDPEFGDYDIRFLHPKGVNAAYYFPHDERERCFKSKEQILAILPNPGLTGGTRIRYAFPKKDLQNAQSRL